MIRTTVHMLAQLIIKMNSIRRGSKCKSEEFLQKYT